jgi:DNA-binding NarL/FixJ family response regulator
MNEERSPIRVLIADDDEDTRVWLSAILEDEETVEIVGAATDTDEAVKMAVELSADVAILDWNMPGGGGGKAASQIKADNPETEIVAFTGMDPSAASYDMMSAGAVAFVQKRCEAGELIDAIHSAARW